LTKTPSTSGPLADVQAAWRELPAHADKQAVVRHACERLRDLVIQRRKEFAPRVERLQVKGISPGSQPFLLWRNDQLARQHMRYSGDSSAPDAAELALFCRVFPDAFVVSERAPYYDASTSAHGRLLSAGFHLMQGYYRDDEPLGELVLDEAGRREIDTLWDELHFATLDATRQYKDFVFFERAEPPRFMQEAAFDFARSEDKDVTSPGKLKQ